jgi:hypothetical protein
MKLPASDSIANYVDTVIRMKIGFIGTIAEEIKPPRLFPTSTLKDIKAIECLYHKFTYCNTKHSLKGRIRFCYKYALQASIINPDLIYCEGLATNKNVMGIPLSHAWCVHKDTGEIWDPVWKNKHEGTGYCGIPLQRKFINEVVLASGVYGVIDSLCLHKEFYDKQLHEVVHKAYHPVLFEK